MFGIDHDYFLFGCSRSSINTGSLGAYVTGDFRIYKVFICYSDFVFKKRDFVMISGVI